MTTDTTTETDEGPAGLGPRLWLAPAVVVTLVMATLAALYLGGTVNPTQNLDGFPIAVVNADAGALAPTGRRVNVGTQISAELGRGIDRDEYDLRVLTLAEAEQELRTGKLYGAIVLPQDLSRKLTALGAAVASGGAVQRPEITVYTNPLANLSSASIVSAFATQVLTSVNEAVGDQLLTSVTSALAPTGTGTPTTATATTAGTLSGAAREVLSAPMDLRVTPFQPAPAGTGNGLSAFYYALLLILAGFTGSLIASNYVDAGLGFVPTEVGPLYRVRPTSGIGRLATLAMKWGLMAGLAVVVSTVYLGLAAWLGMPLDHPWTLWGFSVLVIVAVAVVVQAILALLGSLGFVLNLLVFVVLSIPSAGGTIPLEATPPFIRFLSTFEPMHQIYLGTRSVLYFGAAWDAGLARAVIAATAALVAGLVAGILGTRAYDRRGMTRRPRPVDPPEHAALAAA